MNDIMPSKGATRADILVAVDAIIASATLAEKVGMMSGQGFFKAYTEDGGVWGGRPYRAGSGIERLGLAPLYFSDGPRGVSRGNSTCFPCSMARGATFDTDLEYRIGQVMGIEIRAQDCTLSGAVCMNLLRHPAWGRAQETYGEDSWHIGVMGAALGTGVQVHNVIATVKHFALNSMENARFFVDVRVDERTLHEIYLPHFKFALDAGVATVMSAYNKVNGEFCGQHRHLLTDILRGEWGFTGFVHSDWVRGVHKVYGASAGLDLENPEPLVFGDKLIKAVEDGVVEPAVIDTACRRILETQFRFSTVEDPLPAYPETLVACDAHRAVALETAEKSAVLLENNGVLPFDRNRIKTVALLGRLAAMENTGDNGSSRVRPPYVVTPLTGLQRLLGEANVLVADESDAGAARAAADAADAIVVVVGYTAEDEGEYVPGDLALGQSGIPDDVPDEIKAYRASRPKAIGGDRLDLALPADQIQMIETAAIAGKPVVVVIVAGSAVLVETWRDKVGAILQTFYSGMEGGTALASLLFGRVSPSGRLPFTVARDAADYPFFDRDAVSIDYGYWHGYAKFDREGRVPRYPFGHGLSYAQFSYRAVRADLRGENVIVSVAVTNTGRVTAEDAVLCFVGYPGSVPDRPVRSLRGFQRIMLAPGTTGILTFDIPVSSLRWRDPATHTWRLEAGIHRISVGVAPECRVDTTIVL